MKRAQLEHITRAAASVADDDEPIIVGRQAVLGQFPDAPEYVAAREKDRHFCRIALESRLANRDTLLERLPDLPADDAHRARIAQMISTDASR